MQYNVEGEIMIPNLITIKNFPFRNEETQTLWGVPKNLPELTNLDGIKQGSVHDVVYKNINVNTLSHKKQSTQQHKVNIITLKPFFITQNKFYK